MPFTSEVDVLNEVLSCLNDLTSHSDEMPKVEWLKGKLQERLCTLQVHQLDAATLSAERKSLSILALALLKSEYGVPEAAWQLLRPRLGELNLSEILNAVNATDGYYYIP